MGKNKIKCEICGRNANIMIKDFEPNFEPMENDRRPSYTPRHFCADCIDREIFHSEE